MQSLKSSIVVDALPVCIREAKSGTVEGIIFRVGTIILYLVKYLIKINKQRPAFEFQNED